MSNNETSIVLEKGISLWEDAWIKLRKNRMALIGLGLLVFLCVVSLLTPWIAPYGYEEQNLLLGATPPSAALHKYSKVSRIALFLAVLEEG